VFRSAGVKNLSSPAASQSPIWSTSNAEPKQQNAAKADSDPVDKKSSSGSESSNSNCLSKSVTASASAPSDSKSSSASLAGLCYAAKVDYLSRAAVFIRFVQGKYFIVLEMRAAKHADVRTNIIDWHLHFLDGLELPFLFNCEDTIPGFGNKTARLAAACCCS